MSTHAYLQQETGWILKDELYYLPDTKDLSPPQTEQNKPKSSSQPRKWVDIFGLFCIGIALVVAIAFCQSSRN